MRIKQLLFTFIFAISIYFVPAVVQDFFAGGTPPVCSDCDGSEQSCVLNDCGGASGECQY